MKQPGSAGRHAETRLSHRPAPAALDASKPRDQTTFTRLGQSFPSELQLSRLGRRTDDIFSAQELSKCKPLTQGHSICPRCWRNHNSACSGHVRQLTLFFHLCSTFSSVLHVLSSFKSTNLEQQIMSSSNLKSHDASPPHRQPWTGSRPNSPKNPNPPRAVPRCTQAVPCAAQPSCTATTVYE